MENLRNRFDGLEKFYLANKMGAEGKASMLQVKGNPGEALRGLSQQYKSGTADREARAMAKFMSMVNRQAESPRETRAMMIELIERAKTVEEVTGKAPGDRHVMSVIRGILDLETSKHTSQHQGMKQSVEVLKRKLMECASLVTTNSDHKMASASSCRRPQTTTSTRMRKKIIKRIRGLCGPTILRIYASIEGFCSVVSNSVS